ncbi:hypothetical protein MCP_0476 [Methanocella paludicola SANAE]|uniref:DUF883 domain-containing protein n=2 Tax=Methanocella TaxID=570266 RepID=D1YVS6_METPS|nr:hypothetical protein MCP_0476 [Methanocella paludicola SANAE]
MIFAPHMAVQAWWFAMVEYSAKKDELASSMEQSAARLEDTGARTAGKVAGSMRNLADDIRSFNINEYRDKMMSKVDTARTEVDKNVDNVKMNIRDHPFESVALAAGAGILLGAMIALMGRRSVRSRM